MKIVITSGYYNPLHVGHIEYLEKAKELGDRHIAIINSDLQVQLKGSVTFMNESDRMKIVRALRCVDEVFLSIDKDKSQCESIKFIAKNFWTGNELIFAKGGDRLSYEIPERLICKELGIKIIDGLGEKIQSSSELVKRAKGI